MKRMQNTCTITPRRIAVKVKTSIGGLTCSGGYQGIYHYRLALSIQRGRASIFQEALE